MKYQPQPHRQKLTEDFFAKTVENYEKPGGKYMLETEAYERLVGADIAEAIK